MKKLLLNIKFFFKLLGFLLKAQFKGWSRTSPDHLAARIEIIAQREREEKKEVLEKVNLAILDFHDVGRRSKFIPKEIKTKGQLFTWLKEQYGARMKRCGLGLTPKLKIYYK